MSDPKPCLPGCEVAQSIGYNPFLHAHGCPNAPKFGCKHGMCADGHQPIRWIPQEDWETCPACILRAEVERLKCKPEYHQCVCGLISSAWGDGLAARQKEESK